MTVGQTGTIALQRAYDFSSSAMAEKGNARYGLDRKSEDPTKPLNTPPVEETLRNAVEKNTGKKDENPEAVVRSIKLAYDTEGNPILQFLDGKGNTIFQVPPEQYQKMIESTGKPPVTMNIVSKTV